MYSVHLTSVTALPAVHEHGCGKQSSVKFVPNKNLRKANCAFTEELENDPGERGNSCLGTSRI